MELDYTYLWELLHPSLYLIANMQISTIFLKWSCKNILVIRFSELWMLHISDMLPQCTISKLYSCFKWRPHILAYHRPRKSIPADVDGFLENEKILETTAVGMKFYRIIVGNTSKIKRWIKTNLIDQYIQTYTLWLEESQFKIKRKIRTWTGISTSDL